MIELLGYCVLSFAAGYNAYAGYYAYAALCGACVVIWHLVHEV